MPRRTRSGSRRRRVVRTSAPSDRCRSRVRPCSGPAGRCLPVSSRWAKFSSAATSLPQVNESPRAIALRSPFCHRRNRFLPAAHPGAFVAGIPAEPAIVTAEAGSLLLFRVEAQGVPALVQGRGFRSVRDQALRTHPKAEKQLCDGKGGEHGERPSADRWRERLSETHRSPVLRKGDIVPGLTGACDDPWQRSESLTAQENGSELHAVRR